ncbi:Exocyst complex component 7 [Physocladia obscura]|uniref:Exocyst complex protein EXO70 n=1 Tax=Physocladia obscura TaxID=109957 RepID=A0AAD5X7U8_9FUNG|nr:Exocyst complex component 7 [Physocladia obscura]
MASFNENSDFCDEIKQQEIPTKAILPVDGTVHEITSVTLNIVRRVLDYETVLNAMLIENHGANLSATTLKGLCRDILGLLYANLEAKAKCYKGKIVLSNIKSMGAALTESETEFERGTVVKNLSKQQREAIKDRFKNFNAEVDSMYAVQKGYTVADLELRFQIIKDIKDVLLPLYVNFQERYMHIEFTKNPSKYIKYDKSGLEAVIDGLFTSSADTIEKKFFPNFEK